MEAGIYQQIIRITGQGFWRIDKDAITVEVNPALCRLFGYSEAEMIGHKPFFFTDEKNKKIFESQLSVMKGTLNRDYEITIKHKDGREIFTHFNSTTLRNESGEVFGAFALVTDLTHLHTNENAAKISIQRYEKFMLASPMGMHIYELDVNDNLIFSGFNPAADRILGVSNAPFMGKTIEEAFPPLANTEIPGKYKEVALTGSPWEKEVVEYEDKTVNGAFKIFAFQIGEKQMAVFFLDITNQKRAEYEIKLRNEELVATEEELQASNEELIATNEALKLSQEQMNQNTQMLIESQVKLRSIFRAAPTGIGMITDKSISFVNRRLCEITGYSREEIFNKELGFLFESETDYQKAREDINRKLSEKSDYSTIVNWKTRGGERIHVMLSITPIDQKDFSMGLTFTVTDITDRVKAEASLILARNNLQESEERFRQLAENTNDVYWLRNNNKILYINPAFERVWGRKAQDVIDNPKILLNYIHPEDIDRFNPWLDISSLEENNYYSEQYRIVKPNGEVRWIWSRIYPVYRDSGKIYRIAGIAADITEQKQTEDALRAAKEKAQESDRLKSAFLANISHEIRTPMNGILGFSNLLEEEGLTAEARAQYVKIITNSSEQLLHIIDDIIDISKIEANQIKISKTEFVLNNLISELELFYNTEKSTIGKQHIHVSSHSPLSDADSRILTDESRLRQILMNLINNALKYTEKGYVEFGYNAKDQFLEFYVKDSGIGIPDELKIMVFRRFRQADEAHARKFGGSGLGLAICDGIVKLLGGNIRLESEIDKGSIFYFTIPFDNVKAAKIDIKNKEEKEFSYLWIDKKILVVEDDNVNFEYINTLLKRTGCQIIHAWDGEEALQICSENKNIDIVLMDIRLPKLNGYEATRQLRLQGSSLPIIAQTAYAMADEKEKCLKAGCDAYVSKPINRNLLLQTISRLMPS